MTKWLLESLLKCITFPCVSQLSLQPTAMSFPLLTRSRAAIIDTIQADVGWQKVNLQYMYYDVKPYVWLLEVKQGEKQTGTN